MIEAVRPRSVLKHPVAVGLVVVALLAAVAVRAFVHRPAIVDRPHTHMTVEDGNVAEVNDPRPEHRLAAVEVIADRQGAAMEDALVQAFHDSDAQVRIRAAEILLRRSPDRGQRLMLAALQDDDLWLRQDAAKQMAVLGSRKRSGIDRRAVPFLMRAVDDYDDVVQIQAMHALKKLTGNDWTVSIRATDAQRDSMRARWQTWWKTAQAKFPLPADYQNIVPLYPARSDPAPQVSIRTIDGKEVRPFAPQGRLTLLNFWGTWCGPCLIEVPDLQKLHEEFGARGVDVVGVAMAEKDGPSGLRSWCQQHGLTYPQAMAEEDALHAYGDIDEVPVSFLIDGQGRIRYRWEGERDVATFRRAVERVLKSNEGR